MRICSLLPSATEIVADLGLADSLVAVSEECDWPPEVRGLPVVTASRVDTSLLSSLEIEQAVRDAIGDGRLLYAIDRELLEALKPDLILTQNLCAVCAISADAVDEFCATEAEVVALDAHTLAEIEERIVSLADLLGVPARGRAVVNEMEAKIAAVGERVAGAPPRPVFVAEWLDRPTSPATGSRRWSPWPEGARCSDRPGLRHTRRRGRRCASRDPSSSSSPLAASTTSAPRAKRRFPRSAAGPSPSTRTPTTPGRRRASPTALRSSPS
jgi:Periplasmic binding protein